MLCLFALVLLAGCTFNPLSTSDQQPTAGRFTAQAATVADLPSPAPAETANSAPANSELPTAAPESSPTAVPAPKPPRGTVGIAAGEDIPGQAVDQLLQLLKDAGAKAEHVQTDADLRLDATPSDGANLAWERFFVPVDRLSSVLGSITLQELRDVWTGASASTNFATIYPDATIIPDLTVLLGAPGQNVKPQPGTALADAVWGDPMGLGIVPFEDLSVRLRAIPLEDNSPTDNRFRADAWPLAGAGLSVSGDRARPGGLG